MPHGVLVRHRELVPDGCMDSPVLASSFLYPEQDPLSLEMRAACWGLLGLEPSEGRLRLREPERDHLLLSSQPVHSPALQPLLSPLPLLDQVWFVVLGSRAWMWHHACLFVPS